MTGGQGDAESWWPGAGTGSIWGGASIMMIALMGVAAAIANTPQYDAAHGSYDGGWSKTGYVVGLTVFGSFLIVGAVVVAIALVNYARRPQRDRPAPVPARATGRPTAPSSTPES